MTADELKALVGRRVALELAPASGEREIQGRVLGTIDASDGLVLVLEPERIPGMRRTVHSHHVRSARAI
ncbi:MAG: hypothetical protein E6I40_08290 [Chloroflexi bacterium]|nr:MAG: hypothetical protein AUG02_05270 [Chloroflexi bacterium 13_1_20CM_2_70_9]TME94350.1 MAG: hypothetical protein E6I40_08290 [Chloroflexota bacterium]TMF64112.1 MAG: hypothetical protein E6I20_08690 [Chloroflexota bacterium]TMG37416.1 MAG: hypothetical protein E6H88_06585 [Chloroflexota bacterium]TMG41713.1 MAG: hypothetical protein E6H94_01135 [Chloroflexota bacterium]